MKPKLVILAIALAVLTFNVGGRAQSANLLQNPNANLGKNSWRAFGDATIETSHDNLYFVVRNGGYFLQDVELPEDAAGQYIVFLGRGSSERINSDGAITGLPYLYGYMMSKQERPNGDRILEYLQGQQMLGQPAIQDEWVSMWGIFKVRQGANRVRFFLNQALRAGIPHNGSAARFDNLGLYLFPTKQEAESFVAVIPPASDRLLRDPRGIYSDFSGLGLRERVAEQP